MLELVELEMMEMLSDFGFDAENTPMIKGSARLALEGTTIVLTSPFQTGISVRRTGPNMESNCKYPFVVSHSQVHFKLEYL